MADKTDKKTRHAKSDLNRADRDELVSVPGIGPAVAETILKHRGDRGGFKSLDELSKVTGNAKSDLNRADRDELVSVPGIGPAVAESILKQRGDRGGFKSLDELSDVTGIATQTVQNLRERFTISDKRGGAVESASKGEAE